MAGSSIKLSVDVTEFKRGMTEAQNSVKTLDAAIKTNEKSMQAYGKSESYVSTQATLLNSKLKEQEKIVQNAEKSLKAMEQNGVSKSSKAYQDMQRRMFEARGAMLDTTMQLNQLTTGEAEAAKGAEQLGNSIGGISKKMSLDQVIGGIDQVTGALENAAKSAIDLGGKLFDAIMDSAAAADDISMIATRLGLTDEQVQQINYNAGRFEITAQQLGKTWKKVKNNMASDSDEIKKAFEELGVQTHEVFGGKYSSIEGDARDYIDVFWEVGDALMRMTDESKREQLAQKLLGRSWDEMIPLFKAGRDEYEKALNAAPTASEEAVENMASLNDRMKELEQSWETLKLEALGAIAPALEKGADAIANLLDKITAYLQTDEGQQMLQKMGDAVSGLFDDLTKIDPEKVVEGFTGVFEKVIGGLQWLDQNSSTVVHAMEAIVTGWAGLKLTGGALEIMKLIDGVKGFQGIDTSTPQNVTDGNGDVIANGGGSKTGATGGFWSNLLNKTTLVALAKTFGDAFDPQKSETWLKFEQNTAGMSAAEKNRYALEHDFGPEVFEALNGEEVPIDVTPEIPEDAALKISEQIGVVPVAVKPVVPNDEPGYIPGGGGGGNNVAMEKANGIWAVPFDGYLARLHKNERVVPAREVSSHSYSSNLYVESMIMNNGTDAEGLAAAMAAAQRRTMTGFGS